MRLIKEILIYIIDIMDYRVAVCSYQRSKGLGEKTLKTLEKYNIPKNKIDIFVANKKEEKIYRELYGEYNIIRGVIGMRQIREFMFNYYDNGDKILFMDDDITDIKELIDSKTKLKDIDDLDKTIIKGFELCEENNTILWGIYPCDNKGFMKHKHSTHLAFCVGWMWGCIIDKECLKQDPRMIGNFEDYERSINVFKKYEKVIRLNNICAKTKYNQEDSGGMNIGDRLSGQKEDLEILKEICGDYLIIKKKKCPLGQNPQIKSNISKKL